MTVAKGELEEPEDDGLEVDGDGNATAVKAFIRYKVVQPSLPRPLPSLALRLTLPSLVRYARQDPH